MSKHDLYNLSKETLLNILNNCYNEIYVTDESLNVIFVNPKCKVHYGLEPEEMIGQNHMQLFKKYWYPTALPLTYKEKHRICIEQVTLYGEKIISTTNPVLDADGNVKMVVSVVQEELKVLDLRLPPESYDDNYLIKRNEKSSCVDIITRSACMQKILNLSKKAACSDIAILIEGESGTGKTMLAKYIHENSNRAKFPFLSINCATIPENLMESELFGYTPYAFTGANCKGKTGLIEMANNGTLFLDEIGELPMHLQAKLLNVVENNQFIPVGGNCVKHVNVRIISATNKNLEKLVNEKKFREDLYWRLNIISLKIPSLTERKNDIVPLANYYLNLYNTKYKTNKVFSSDVIDIFMNYEWLGNIRQLKNIIERAFVFSNKPEITNHDLPEILIKKTKSNETHNKTDLSSMLEAAEKEYIQKAYEQFHTSRKMALSLNISQSKAHKLITKYCADKCTGSN